MGALCFSDLITTLILRNLFYEYETFCKAFFL